MTLLLASKSPRRRQLLAELGYPVKTIDVDVDEHIDTPLPANCVAEYLACRKAEAYPVTSLANEEVLVTADTVVVLDDQVLGKPASRDEAVAMLHNLSGRSHEVFTGVCLRTTQRNTSFTERTVVHFRSLSDSEIDYYVDNYRPYDKAGAYGIQEWIGMVGISHIEGCYYNVMGLPVAHLYAALQEITR